MANHKLAGVLPVRLIFDASGAIGNVIARLRAKPADEPAMPHSRELPGRGGVHRREVAQLHILQGRRELAGGW